MEEEVVIDELAFGMVVVVGVEFGEDTVVSYNWVVHKMEFDDIPETDEDFGVVACVVDIVKVVDVAVILLGSVVGTVDMALHIVSPNLLKIVLEN